MVGHCGSGYFPIYQGLFGSNIERLLIEWTRWRMMEDRSIRSALNSLIDKGSVCKLFISQSSIHSEVSPVVSF